MATILHIETSGPVCSVALSKDGVLLFEKINMQGQTHADHLAGYVQEAMQWCDEHEHTIEAVSVSSGPGSYTGLRIGVSLAKGICYGKNIPLIAIDTLMLMACSVLFKKDIDDKTLLCPMIDARRMEVYAVLYDHALRPVRETLAEIITSESFSDYLEKGIVWFFGDGATKCKEVIQHPNARFLDGVYPSAKEMIALAEKYYYEKRFADVAYFEPFYLKEFQITQSKNKIIQP